MKLYLDDDRACPPGWTLARSVKAAQDHLRTGTVLHLSLDHDLGACTVCMDGLTVEEWYRQKGANQAMPHCPHVGTGFDLLRWMQKTGFWSRYPPTVHSMNIVERPRMYAFIHEHFPYQNTP